MPSYRRLLIPPAHAQPHDVERLEQMYNLFEREAYFLGKVPENAPLFSVTMDAPNIMVVSSLNGIPLNFCFDGTKVKVDDRRETDGFLEVKIESDVFHIREPPKSDSPPLASYRNGLNRHR